PWSRFWASDWPFNAPTGAIFLHWIFTTALILGSQTQDVYQFVTNVFIYSGNWIKGGCGFFLVAFDFTIADAVCLFDGSVPRRRAGLPQLCSVGAVGGTAHDVPQLAAADHLLDPVAAVRAGGTGHQEQDPRDRAI